MYAGAECSLMVPTQVLRASAAISAFSILVTLTVVALACGISACIKRRRRHRARYDLFPTDLFNTRDLNWYPPSGLQDSSRRE